MSRLTSDSMTVIINGIEYSTFIDNVSVSGGTPIYSYTPVWNGRKKRIVTGYNEFVITLSMLMDNSNSAFIDNLEDYTQEYTISLGESGVIYNTYSNMYASEWGDTINAADGIQIMEIKFVAEGIPDNKS